MAEAVLKNSFRPGVGFESGNLLALGSCGVLRSWPGCS